MLSTMRQAVQLAHTRPKIYFKLLSEETMPTWPQAEDESAVRIWVGQNCEETLVQNMFHCGWFQILEHLRPSLMSRVVIEQQLQSTVIIELPGPQES